MEKPLLRGKLLDAHELPSLANWFPVSITDDGPSPTVWWRGMGQGRFLEPFFHDTLAAQPVADRQVCQTPLAALAGFDNSVAPTAFVFHVSRCGSTLVTQMLAALPQCIVMSEPPVLDAFFRLHHHQPARIGGAHTLRQLVAALGQRRTGQEQHCFIKLDCWHMSWMPWLRQVFAHTPFVLIYRDPDEVMASHRRLRGAQMVPGLLDTSLLQPDTTALAPADFDGYTARVLDAIYASALACVGGTKDLSSSDAVTNVTLINYNELPDAVCGPLLAKLGVVCSADDLRPVQARAKRHSKHENNEFEGDPKANEFRPVNDRPALAVQALRSYAALEKIRRGHAPA